MSSQFNHCVFPWCASFHQEFATADAPQRMVLAARLWACGHPEQWREGGYASDAQRDSWLMTAADAAGRAVVAAHTADGAQMAAALFMAQDVQAAVCAVEAEGVTPEGEAAIAVAACLEAAEDAVLDVEAVECIESWPWRRLMDDTVQLAVIAAPVSMDDLYHAMASLASRPSAPEPTSAPPPETDTCDTFKQDCGAWINSIRDLEGIELREHFQTAWKWTAQDRPVFQLTWLLQDKRRMAADRVYALHALARYAHPLGWHIIARHCRRDQETEAAVRLQACLAMCWTGRLALEVLPAVLADAGEDLPVRLAAARSLLSLCDDDAAQALAREVDNYDREDRRLLAVAAVARGDGDALACLALDGYGAPELPRWGLTAIGRQLLPSHDQLVRDLCASPQTATVTLLELPVLAVQHPAALASAALEAARRPVDRSCGAASMLLRAAACLHDQGIAVWQALARNQASVTRCAIAQGLAGSDAVTSIDGHLRSAHGLDAILAVIGDDAATMQQRDHAMLLLVLHRRLHPSAPMDMERVRWALRCCLEAARAASQDPSVERARRRVSWVIGTLRVPDMVQDVAPELGHALWAPWTLSQLEDDASRDVLRHHAQDIEPSQVSSQLLWALVERRLDVGRRVLNPAHVTDQGFWRYAMLSGNTHLETLLDKAPESMAVAYQVFLGREPDAAVSLHVVHQAWRGLEQIGRPDLLIGLIPQWYALNPHDAWERIVHLGDDILKSDDPRVMERLRQVMGQVHDRRLVMLLRGLQAVLGTPAVPIPVVLHDLLRPEERRHLGFAGRQMHASDGQVRGAGVVELARTYEESCRHHIASHLMEPLARLVSSGHDTSVLKQRLRADMAEADMGDVDPHDYLSRVDDVCQAAHRHMLLSPSSEARIGLDGWATAIALVHRPHRSSPTLRRGLRTMWKLQDRRRELAQGQEAVPEQEADTMWQDGIESMPDVMRA